MPKAQSGFPIVTAQNRATVHFASYITHRLHPTQISNPQSTSAQELTPTTVLSPSFSKDLVNPALRLSRPLLGQLKKTTVQQQHGHLFPSSHLVPKMTQVLQF
jgi:hypothetical protein